MILISRKAGESVVVGQSDGPDLEVRVLEVTPDGVRLAVCVVGGDPSGPGATAEAAPLRVAAGPPWGAW